MSLHVGGTAEADVLQQRQSYLLHSTIQYRPSFCFWSCSLYKFLTDWTCWKTLIGTGMVLRVTRFQITVNSSA